jgi:hypothetical protein
MPHVQDLQHFEESYHVTTTYNPTFTGLRMTGKDTKPIRTIALKVYHPPFAVVKKFRARQYKILWNNPSRWHTAPKSWGAVVEMPAIRISEKRPRRGRLEPTNLYTMSWHNLYTMWWRSARYVRISSQFSMVVLKNIRTELKCFQWLPACLHWNGGNGTIDLRLFPLYNTHAFVGQNARIRGSPGCVVAIPFDFRLLTCAYDYCCLPSSRWCTAASASTA